MKKTLSLTLLLLVASLYFSCSKKSSTGNNPPTVTTLDYVAFMKYPYDTIADSLAGILNVTPLSFNQKVAGIRWTKEGYEYTATNEAKVTVWVDTNDQPYFVSYLLRRGGTSDDWSYDQDKADSTIISILGQTGISLDGTEDFISKKYAAGHHKHWYHIMLSQTFRDTALYYPYILAEVEGNTGKVNYLGIHRWYLNLSEIENVLSYDDLNVIAIDYYRANDEVISLPDSIRILGLYIINDMLCKKVGSAIIDEWGSTLDLFIDIQTGEIVDVDRIFIG